MHLQSLSIKILRHLSTILEHNVLRYCIEIRELVQDAEQARQPSETATQMYADTNFTRPTVQMHTKKKKNRTRDMSLFLER